MNKDKVVADDFAWHESLPVSLRSMTIEHWEQEAAAAKAKGCTHWATSTNKSQSPWVTTIVFWKPVEEE